MIYVLQQNCIYMYSFIIHSVLFIFFFRMFLDWSKNTSRFLAEIKKVLEKLGLPLEVPPEPIRDKIDEVILRESVFTSLFMKFTEIFFLQPE